ncbi:hypothetical protein FSP39_009656 [Pinctada imbricata]|uniref:Gag-like protein n=1 Tax=Pinctada imbricata TaxID=66713 RepID=A0AA88YQK8_PINIB|nr:hypothetical protein FSP39_009656 [Pinctada imbricata]
MHTKFKINIIPLKTDDSRVNLDNVKSTLTSAQQDRPYQFRSLERGPGAYLLVNKHADARFWICFLQLRFADIYAIYLVDSPRYKTVVLKGGNTKAKSQGRGQGQWLPNHILTSKIAEKHDNLIAAQRLLNKEKRPTGAIKATFFEEAPKKVLGLGPHSRAETYVPPAPRCHKCHGFHATSRCRATEATKCAKCGGDHEQKQCSSTGYKCLNCGGAHHTYYRDCPENKRHRAAHVSSITDGISYAAAVQKNNALLSTVQRPTTQNLTKTVADTVTASVTESVNTDFGEKLQSVLTDIFKKLMPTKTGVENAVKDAVNKHFKIKTKTPTQGRAPAPPPAQAAGTGAGARLSRQNKTKRGRSASPQKDRKKSKPSPKKSIVNSKVRHLSMVGTSVKNPVILPENFDTMLELLETVEERTASPPPGRRESR